MSSFLIQPLAVFYLLPLSLSLQHAEEKAREQEKCSKGTSSSPLKAQKSKADKKRASLKRDDDFKPTAGCLLLHITNGGKWKELLCFIVSA